MTYIWARESDEPVGRSRIDWKLITNLPVETAAAATEKLSWYAMRWKIEIFQKILKSGCKAEEVKLRTADRLVNLLAIFCFLSWRVFWVTMSSRSSPKAPPETALTTIEIKVLDHLAPDKPRDRNLPAGIGCYALKIAVWAAISPEAVIPHPATPQHRHVAWPFQAHRHYARDENGRRACG